MRKPDVAKLTVRPATVITNVRVFDGQNLTGPTTVVVVDGLISGVQAPADAEVVDGLISGVQAPADAEVVDGAGGTLLPGLIDTHAHVSDVSHLKDAAEWGVTTMLDMAARKFDATMALRDLPGMTSLRTAGRPASGEDSMFITTMGFSPETAVAGPVDAARFIRDRVADGSDYIKIMVEDPMFPGTKPLPAETIAALVVEAHKAGFITIAHVVSADTLRTAVNAGVDVVTHTALTAELGSQFEEQLRTTPVTIIPTLAMMEGVVHSIGGRPMMRVLSVVVPALRMKYRFAEATVATFQRAGKTVLVGTDANDEKESPFQLPHGESLHDELERLVRAGLTPVDALRGATTLAADTFGLADRGSVSSGLRADLLLVGGDPTVDITATRGIRGVWIGGVRSR